MPYGSGSAYREIKFKLEERKSKRLGHKYATTKRKLKEFYTPDITKEELEKIKFDIRAKGKRQRIIENSITILLTIIFLILLYFLFF
ncbi:MAG: hypothetical protein PSN34_03550 [Urechidicola sp.]|nr:hypothetical protein [Urechidicola sp.]